MMIILDLSKHCIETEIKKLYNRSVSQYFKPDADKAQLEKEIEILQKALETFNFNRLRSDYPQLSGHHNDSVALIVNDQNQITLLIEGKPIDPFLPAS